MATLAEKNERYAKESEELMGRITDLVSGVLKGATTDVAGAPVDIANMVLKAAGLGSEKPIGGSKNLREVLGYQAEDKNAVETLGTFINPTGAAKAMIVAAARIPERLRKYEEATDKIFAANPSLMKLTDEQRAQVFLETNAYKDKDGKVKTFVSTADAKIDPYAVEVDKANKTVSVIPNFTLGDILADTATPRNIYDIYPEFLNLAVASRGKLNSGSMELDNAFMTIGPQKTFEGVRSVATHELQHAIQHEGNFAKGGSTEMFTKFDVTSVQEKLNRARKSGDVAQIQAADRFAKKLNSQLDEARNRYLNLPGEQEARFSQETINMTNPELKDELYKLLQKGDTPQTWDTRPIRPLGK